jgi:dTDP-4-dehydrorhamnose reductase
MFGRDLVDTLTEAGEDPASLGRADLDTTDPVAVTAAVESAKPDVVVN